MQGENCDDGNRTSGDGCNRDCQVEEGNNDNCGNSIVEDGEVCDPLDDVTGYWCNNTCDAIPPLCANHDNPSPYMCPTGWIRYDGGTVQIEGRTLVVPAFWIRKSEILYEDYMNCVMSGECDDFSDTIFDPSDPFNRCTHATGLNMPVVCRTDSQLEDYAFWAGAFLPDETQWVYVATNSFRMGDNQMQRPTNYPWGSATPACSYANLSCTSPPNPGEIEPVCSYLTGHNASGVCDLIGNVAEIVYSESDGFAMLVGGSHSDSGYNVFNVSGLNQDYDWNASVRIGSRLANYVLIDEF